MKLTSLLTASGIIGLTASAHAATLVDWTFTGNDPSAGGTILENDSADGVVVASSSSFASTLAGVTSSDIMGYGDAKFSLGTSGGAPLYQDELNLRGFVFSGATGGVSTGGYDFTLTAASGTINITEFTVDLWRNGAGAPDTFFIEANVDGGGFVQFGSNSVESNSGDETFRTQTFTGDITGSSIVLRINATGNTGNVHFNDIQVTGDLIAVPEPSSAALLGLGGLALILRRRM